MNQQTVVPRLPYVSQVSLPDLKVEKLSSSLTPRQISHLPTQACSYISIRPDLGQADADSQPSIFSTMEAKPKPVLLNPMGTGTIRTRAVDISTSFQQPNKEKKIKRAPYINGHILISQGLSDPQKCALFGSSAPSPILASPKFRTKKPQGGGTQEACPKYEPPSKQQRTLRRAITCEKYLDKLQNSSKPFNLPDIQLKMEHAGLPHQLPRIQPPSAPAHQKIEAGSALRKFAELAKMKRQSVLDSEEEEPEQILTLRRKYPHVQTRQFLETQLKSLEVPRVARRDAHRHVSPEKRVPLKLSSPIRSGISSKLLMNREVYLQKSLQSHRIPTKATCCESRARVPTSSLFKNQDEPKRQLKVIKSIQTLTPVGACHNKQVEAVLKACSRYSKKIKREDKDLSLLSLEC